MLSWLGIMTFVPLHTAVVFKSKSVQFGTETLEIVSLKAECFKW